MAKRPSKPRTTASEQLTHEAVENAAGVSLWQRTAQLARSEQFRVITAVLLALFTAYLLLAFISFFFTGVADFSIVEMSRAERAMNRMEIQNIMGLPGAAMVYLMVHQTFGLASAAIFVLFTAWVMRLLRAGDFKLFKLSCCVIFWLLYGAMVLGYIDYLSGQPLFFRLGGAFGEWVNTWAISYIRPIGWLFVLLAIGITFFVSVDANTLPRLKQFGRWIKQLASPRTPASTGESSQGEGDKEELPADDDVQQTETTNEIDLSFATEGTDTNTAGEDPSLTFEIVNTKDDASSEGTVSEVTEEDVSSEVPAADQVTEETPETADLTIEQSKAVELTDKQQHELPLEDYDPRKDLEFYRFPDLDLLKVYPNETSPVIDQQEQQNNAGRIVTALQNFGVEIDSIKATVGPTVTLYEVKPKAGVKISRIQSLESDIMLSLAAKGIRIIAPMPGKGTVGIEVPNEKPQVVSMHSVIASKNFQDDKKMRLPVAIGRTITNDVFMFDLAKTPHLLVAGATGQGKSVAINAIITSLLYKKHPAEMKMVLVDPKMVEFAPYKPLLRHYLAAMPDADENQIVITDCDKVINTLNSLVIEMENRYKLLMDAGVRNLEDYNDKFIHRHLNPEKVIDGSLHHRFLPYIVIIIDEYGDFIMQAGKQVETPIARITQKARAVGMHMILATQRPSVNIVTGVIKANIPTRIALRTQSVIDSRTVLDAKGADQLIGRGDMLYAGNGDITRIQCAFVDTPEVDAIVEHIKEQQHYFEPYQLPEYVPEGADNEPLKPGSVDMKRLDPMFADVARYVVNKQEGSTSRLQRAFEIGFNRAGKLSDQLEAAGIVGPNKGPKGRDVLIQDPNQLEALLSELGC